MGGHGPQDPVKRSMLVTNESVGQPEAVGVVDVKVQQHFNVNVKI